MKSVRGIVRFLSSMMPKSNPCSRGAFRGGLDCAEITFRTATRRFNTEDMQYIPDMLVGAGTVLSIEQVDKSSGGQGQSL